LKKYKTHTKLIHRIQAPLLAITPLTEQSANCPALPPSPSALPLSRDGEKRRRTVLQLFNETLGNGQVLPRNP